MLAALPLTALVLAGCAGPRPAPEERIDTAAFIALAVQAPCAGTGNRLFAIDDKLVFWDRGASCQDQVLRLYGTSASKPLCVNIVSAQGTYTNCSNDSVRALFETILANRQAADLGMGAGHTVTQIGFAPEVIVNLPFTTIAKDAFSAIHAPRTVVVRGVVAWEKLWAEHTAGRSPAPPLPQVDFATQMLIAAFAGDLKGCHEFDIRRVNVRGNNIVAEFEDRDITPQTICLAAITNPMHVVAVPLIESDVVFNQITPGRIDFNTIDRTAFSGIEEPMNVVIRDARSWARLWARHTGSSANLPAIDFRTTVVIGVFRGLLPNLCYATEIIDVYRVGSGINVARVDTFPGPEAGCGLSVVTPAHLIAIPSSTESIVFSTERRPVPQR
jgi:hypothetical protein